MVRTNREFCPLAETYQEGDSIGGMVFSEKLDGKRCLWDGGLTRGMLVSHIPWYNSEGDYRYINQSLVCTGLWSRYGKVIHAPSWWVDQLPHTPLDGELWLGRGRFQELESIITRLEGGPQWESVRLVVFDILDIRQWLTYPGKINNPNYKQLFPVNWQAYQWLVGEIVGVPSYHWEYNYNKLIEGGSQGVMVVHPHTHTTGIDLSTELEKVVAAGGEGLILRDPTSIWLPLRSRRLLKVKPELVGEGTITGFTPGKGKYLGMLGALVITINGSLKRLELSGMTDTERQLSSDGSPVCFRLGEVIRFKYRELSDSGIPKEARYYR